MRRFLPALSVLIMAGGPPSTTPPVVGNCVALIYQTNAGLPAGWTPCAPGMAAADGGIVGSAGGRTRMAWRGFTITDATPSTSAAAVTPCKGMWCTSAVQGMVP